MKVKIKQPVQGRIMPERKAKKSTKHVVEQLPVTKSTRKTSLKTGKGKLSPAKIRLLYTKRDLGKLRPTALETIFEETEETNDNTQYFGLRKMKRSVIFKSVSQPTKLIQRLRLKKIKKYFGHKKQPKKVSMTKFMEAMNKISTSETDETANNVDEDESAHKVAEDEVAHKAAKEESANKIDEEKSSKD